MAVLELLNGPGAGRFFPLEGERSILGRHPDCDIVLDVGAVSRQHAQILHKQGAFLIEDLGSRNGTFVNGRAIQTPHRLQDGDRVKICDLSFDFYHEAPTDRGPRVEGLGDPLGTALLVDDYGQSTIMSKLDVSTGAGGVRLSVNPEIKLRALIEITQSLSKALALEEVLPKLLDGLFKIFVQADRGFIVIKMPDGRLIPKAIRHRSSTQDETVRISRTIVDQVLTTKQAILSADAASDQRFEMSQSVAEFRIRSMMCAPLVDGEGNALGMIQIDTLNQRAKFQQEDLDVLAGVAMQAAFAIDNAQLHERAMKQKSIQRDLELAHKVQQGFLPSCPPKIQGFHFFDFYEPAYQVGGDFYDYIKLPGGRLAVVLADVSGKGVSAALVMAKLSSEVRYGLASEAQPAKAVKNINAAFCQAGWEDRFVTLVLAMIDTATRQVTIVNAGHMAPLLRHGTGKVEAIGADLAGIPLGVDAGYDYEQHTIPLAPGNFLTVFTDGISEAMNAKSELYGFQRLNAQVGAPVQDAASLGKRILEDVKKHVGGHPQSDDMCIVCFG